MITNDINFRIQRLLRSIGEIYDPQVEKHYKKQHVKKGNKVKISISFDGINDDVTSYNKAISVIGNLAKLKDHFKNYFLTNGLDPNIVEDAINKSGHLRWLIDLDNSEKHGYPLRKPRSIEEPVLKDVRAGLTLSKDPFDHLNVREIETKNGISYTSNVVVAISGTVYSKEGEKLCGIDELINKSLSVWENIYTEHMEKSFEY